MHYRDRRSCHSRIVGGHFLHGLERQDAGLAELAGFWSNFESAARRPGWSGCLVMRTVTDRIAADPKVAMEIEAFFERLSYAFENALYGALKRGEISADPPPQIRARQAFAIVVACSTIGSFEGFSPRSGDLIEAGRAACSVPACAPAAQLPRRISKQQ